jgi:pre-mRNA-splicing helicase BRR2
VEQNDLTWFKSQLRADSLPELFPLAEERLQDRLAKAPGWNAQKAADVARTLAQLPHVDVTSRASRTEDGVSVHVELARRGPKPRSAFAIAPRFPKPKQDGWWIVVGSPSSGELLALRRVASATCSVTLTIPASQGAQLMLYVMSDSYLGLNQQYVIRPEPVTSTAE